MPTYEYQCNTCEAREELIFKISEYDEKNLIDKLCQSTEGCEGTYEYVLDGAKTVANFKGDGWTPRFHRPHGS